MRERTTPHHGTTPPTRNRNTEPGTGNGRRPENAAPRQADHGTPTTPTDHGAPTEHRTDRTPQTRPAIGCGPGRGNGVRRAASGPVSAHPLASLKNTPRHPAPFPPGATRQPPVRLTPSARAVPPEKWDGAARKCLKSAFQVGQGRSSSGWRLEVFGRAGVFRGGLVWACIRRGVNVYTLVFWLWERVGGWRVYAWGRTCIRFGPKSGWRVYVWAVLACIRRLVWGGVYTRDWSRVNELVELAVYRGGVRVRVRGDLRGRRLTDVGFGGRALDRVRGLASGASGFVDLGAPSWLRGRVFGCGSGVSVRAWFAADSDGEAPSPLGGA